MRGVDEDGLVGSDGSAATYLQRGSTGYRHASLGLFFAGLTSFSLIYCVQPLLPAFALSFERSPAQASLALSVTTGMLAVSIVLCGIFSGRLPRRGVMFGAMMIASACNLLAALPMQWEVLLLVRAVEGFALGGVPAIAMTYLGEEIEPQSLGRAMGTYVAGTAFGAMVGRVGMGLLADLTSWQTAMAIMGLTGLVSAMAFWVLLPPSRRFAARKGQPLRQHLTGWLEQLRRPALQRLFLVGFCLTSIFVTLFNYSVFRLTGTPFDLSQGAVSLIFLTFAFGIVSSSVGGALVDRLGRRPMLVTGFALALLGVLATLSSQLPLVVLGISLVTTGFFIGHSAASSSVSQAAGSNKGSASALYLLFYYLGSSLSGSAGGWFWSAAGWEAVAGFAAAFALLGIVLSAWPARRL